MTPDTVGIEILSLLFLVASVAGLIDSIAGGGGLLTVPMLLAVGLPPINALATNKLQGVFGSLGAFLHYLRHGHLDLSRLWPLAVVCFLAGILGSIALLHVSPEFLRILTPLLLICVIALFSFQPRLGESDHKPRMGMAAFTLFACGGIGLYDGFFGPGTGTFYAVAFVFLLGHNLIKATAHTKLMNFASNAGSLVLFVLAGQVVWPLGLTMAAGQFLGGTLGAHLTLRHGVALVRSLVILVSLSLTVKLLYQKLNGL